MTACCSCAPPQVCVHCVFDELPPDEPYDDSQDHEACPDCGTSGRDPVYPTDWCELCDGSGWL